MQAAEAFVQAHCRLEDGLTLRYWRGDWWRWQKSHWENLDNHAIETELYRFTEHAVFVNTKIKNPTIEPWAPTRYRIADLRDALSAVCALRREIEQPCWLDGRTTGTIVATRNGLLDIISRECHPHSAVFQSSCGAV
jgi:hypothetical protein